jgi:hypothetical protein
VRFRGRLGSDRDVVLLEPRLCAVLVSAAITRANIAATAAMTMCPIMLASPGGR